MLQVAHSVLLGRSRSTYSRVSLTVPFLSYCEKATRGKTAVIIMTDINFLIVIKMFYGYKSVVRLFLQIFKNVLSEEWLELFPSKHE